MTDVKVLEIDQEAARFKAADQVAVGLRTLDFYAAAFSKSPDLNGDIIDPSAFDEWLKAFYAAGRPLPISFSHAAVIDSIDPTNVIGYASANPSHVWVDDYGLRVSAFLDVASEKGKAVEWQIENKLIGGASIAYHVPAGGVKREGDHNRVMVAHVREAGPTPNPANQEAVLLWMKSQHMTETPTELPYMTADEFRATFKSEPEPEPQPEPEIEPEPMPVAEVVSALKHAASPAYIQSAHDALVRGGAKCAEPSPIQQASDDVAARLRRMRFIKTSLA